MRGKKHGYSHSPNYQAWRDMIQRCTNTKKPLYKNYGGRGITVCDRWLNDISAFIEDVGLRPSKEYSLERINNSGNYEPGNVRWATRKEQARNKRNNHLVTINGTSLTIAEWSERSGIKVGTMLIRIHLGWPSERLIEPHAPSYPRPRRNPVHG